MIIALYMYISEQGDVLVLFVMLLCVFDFFFFCGKQCHSGVVSVSCLQPAFIHKKQMQLCCADLCEASSKRICFGRDAS